MNIILIGFMGCGKSTVAKHLGLVTGRAILDIDQLIVEKTGRSIADIFATDGEHFFRRLETQILIELSEVKNVIIATGGGIIEKRDNWPLLRALGRLFFLDVPWHELQKRIAGDKSRPLGGDGNNWEPVRKLWERRYPFYRQADEIIAADNMSVTDVVREIIRREKRGPT